MSKIKELRENAQKLLTEATSLRDGITDKTPLEEARAANDKFDAMMDQYDGLIKEAEREERAMKAQREAAADAALGIKKLLIFAQDHREIPHGTRHAPCAQRPFFGLGF